MTFTNNVSRSILHFIRASHEKGSWRSAPRTNWLLVVFKYPRSDLYYKDAIWADMDVLSCYPSHKVDAQRFDEQVWGHDGIWLSICYSLFGVFRRNGVKCKFKEEEFSKLAMWECISTNICDWNIHHYNNFHNAGTWIIFNWVIVTLSVVLCQLCDYLSLLEHELPCLVVFFTQHILWVWKLASMWILVSF